GVCDFVTLVVNECHADQVRNHLPDWCGILVASSQSGKVIFSDLVVGRRNPQVDSMLRAQLLWRTEALAILESRGLADGCRSKPRYKLWEVLASRVDADDLNNEIVAAIKSREGWRSDRQRAQCDATP